MKRYWFVLETVGLMLFVAVSVQAQNPPPVVNQPPPSSSGWPDSATVGFYAVNTQGTRTLATRFFLEVKDPNLRIRRFEFDFGDGGKERRDPTPSYEYARPGIYSVTLEVVAEDGRVIRIVKPDYIVVKDRLPEIDFGAEPMSGAAPLQVIFRAVNTGGTVVRYKWLPDSVVVVTATADSLVYTYTRTGIYSVTLTAVGAGGDVIQSKKNFIVVMPPLSLLALVSLPAVAVIMDSTVIGSFSQKTFGVGNVGNTDLVVSSIVVAGANAGEFKVSLDGLSIKPGRARLLTVTFIPSSRGLKLAVAAVIHNTLGSPSAITLTGVGITAPQLPPLAPADFDGSGTIGLDDFFLFAAAFGQPVTAVNRKFDLNHDDVIDFADFFIFAEKFGK